MCVCMCTCACVCVCTCVCVCVYVLTEGVGGLLTGPCFELGITVKSGQKSRSYVEEGTSQR